MSNRNASNTTTPMDIPSDLMPVLEALRQAGGEPYIVGGAVRDWCLSLKPKDFDVEVFHITFEKMQKVLSTFGTAEKAGSIYSVIPLRIGEHEYDFSVPRTEVSTGPGPGDFAVTSKPDMSMVQASKRRDFTINALYYCPFRERIFDFWGGREDLKQRILRPVNTVTFLEDPARILRAFRLISQLGFEANQKVFEMANYLLKKYRSIPKERLWKEWYAWATKAAMPSKGLTFLRDSNWAEFYYFWFLKGVPQHPEWHPEGDVWTHTLLCCDEMVTICDREGIFGERRALLMFAIFCHDFGKVLTTVSDEATGAVTARGHEEASVSYTRHFLENIGASKDFTEIVCLLVRWHLAHISFDLNRGDAGKTAARRLANKLAPANIQDLVLVMEADHSGRPPLPKGIPVGALRLLSFSEAAEVSTGKMVDILMGRHLLELGMTPGKEMGLLLSKAREAQVEGEFTDLDGAICWAKYYSLVEQYLIPGQRKPGGTDPTGWRVGDRLPVFHGNWENVFIFEVTEVDEAGCLTQSRLITILDEKVRKQE